MKQTLFYSKNAFLSGKIHNLILFCKQKNILFSSIYSVVQLAGTDFSLFQSFQSSELPD